jgi:pimeloyl-ACP methyl ester carboxylesterase
MAEFLLIHGSCHGAWCWRDVVPALRAHGHGVRAIDLPGHGDDTTPPDQVTLEAWADAILAAIETPVVLVGHSMAGFAIAAAAEKAPEKIARLVFLCAYLPRDGVSLVEMRREAPYQPLMHAIDKSADGKSFTIRDDCLQAVFYHDCPEDTLAFARARLCAQVIAPQATEIRLGAAFDSVAKSYVVCADDRTIPPDYQRQMSAGLARSDVVEMECSHSPFFADPEGVARHLHNMAAT